MRSELGRACVLIILLVAGINAQGPRAEAPDSACGVGMAGVCSLWQQRLLTPLLDDGRSDLRLGLEGRIHIGGAGGIVTYDSNGKQKWASSRVASVFDFDPSLDRIYASGRASADSYDVFALSASDGQLIWDVRFAHPFLGPAVSLVSNSQGIFVVGSDWSSTSEDDVLVLRYDTSGGLLWSMTYDSPDHLSDISAASTLDVDGNGILVTGRSALTTKVSIFVLSIDEFGRIAWARFHAGEGEGTSGGTAIKTGAGKVIVAGRVAGLVTNRDIGLLALEPENGDVLWTAAFDRGSTGPDEAPLVEISPDQQSIFLGGASWSAEGGYDMVTAKFDMNDGRLRWASYYDGPPRGADQVEALATTTNGDDLYVLGTSEGLAPPDIDGNHDFALVAYDPEDGSTEWVVRYNSGMNGDDYASAIAVDSSAGRIYVSGASSLLESHVGGLPDNGFGSVEIDYVTLAYDADPQAGDTLCGTLC